MKKLLGLSFIAVFAFFPIVASEAADFPKGPITYVIPFNPGAASDMQARMQQPHLEKILGVPILINYMPGAGGALAWTKFSQIKPDGYTMCGINIPHIMLQPLGQKDANFKTEDLKPLCLFETTPIGIAVKKDSKINSVKEFIEFAKANPNKITIGMSGKLSGHHVASLEFEKMMGIKLTQVTFTGGAPQITAILGGHIEAIWGNSSEMSLHEGGMKILAIGDDQRLSFLPNVPTFQELGYKFNARIDRGVAVPKDTPPDITARLEKAFLEVMNNEEYKSKVAKAGVVPLKMGNSESTKYIQERTEVFRNLLAEHNLIIKR